MKNSEDKIIINYDDITQYYDLYVNGLNVVASGSLYLTGGNTDLFLSEDPIIVNGVDSGKTGVEYDFDVISEYCLKVSQFQPNGPGELDFIFVSNNKLYQLSEMYNYGYHKILVETEENFIFNNAIIITLQATNITQNSAILNATLVDDLPGSLVTETGFNWSTDPDNLINIESVGNSTGEFSFELNDLDSQTTYYFQAYAANGNMIKLGSVLYFNTKADFNDATIVTLPATEIDINSVVLNANLVDDLSGALVTETGFNWGIDPDNLSNTESVGNSVGDFSLELIDLDPQTTYYYQAYAANGDIFKLGNILSFNTKANFSDATVITLQVTDITQNSAILNATLIDDLPGSLVTETGFNWGTNPDNLDNTIIVGNSVGDFSVEIDELNPGTTYYFQPYIRNETITIEGDLDTFVTEEEENEFNAEMLLKSAAHNLGDSAFHGATTVGDWAVFAPWSADYVLAYNPLTNTLLQSASHNLGDNAFRGATTVGDWAVFAPYNADYVLAYNPLTNTLLQSAAHNLVDTAFYGATTVGDWAVFAPSYADYVLAYNPLTNTLLQSAAHNLGYNAFCEATTVGDWAVFAPCNADYVLAYNPLTNTLLQSAAHNLGNNAFREATTVGDWAVFAPWSADYVLAYNPLTNTLLQSAAHNLGNTAFYGATTVGDWAVFAPYNAEYVLAYNPLTNTSLQSAAHKLEVGAFRESTTVGDWAVFAPCNADYVLAYNPLTNTLLQSAAHNLGNNAFYGATTVGDWAVFAPYYADYVLAVH